MTVTNILTSEGQVAEVCFRKENEIFYIPNTVLYQVTGSGYNGEGDVLCGSERITYDSHPSISKIVEVRSF